VNRKKRKQVKFIKVKIQKSKVILPAALSPQSLPTVQTAAKKKKPTGGSKVSLHMRSTSEFKSTRLEPISDYGCGRLKF